MEDVDGMMKALRLLVPQFVCAALVAAWSTIPAPETVLQADPAQTRVEFTLASTLHTVHGRFQLKRGTIRFEPATGKASGELVVDGTSGATGNGSRDRRRYKDAFQRDRFPEICLPARFGG